LDEDVSPCESFETGKTPANHRGLFTDPKLVTLDVDRQVRTKSDERQLPAVLDLVFTAIQVPDSLFDTTHQVGSLKLFE
jgi:hypothetical protein